ncbi:MAG: AlwI family type II restriction endonuclease [Treponema sp.]|nr:AlwI family type II restriction endonuclease [Treponema sp.]
MPHFPFKSYCWSVGTTSFRTVDFNLRIERQLDLLNKFWNLPNNIDKSWRCLQHDYYRYMQENNFVKGNAPNPMKDAREKTSGLKNIGLIDGNRKLTSVGKALLDISINGNYKSDNILKIPKDSFLYLKQLLKTSNDIDGDIVRPFVVTIYVLLQLDCLNNDEFTYLLPLCTNKENTEIIINKIKNLRKGIGTIEEIITSRLMLMENYKNAIEYFLSENVSEDIITTIGMNRKSSGAGKKAYDKPYHQLYKLLFSYAKNRDEKLILPLFEQSKKLKGNTAAFWRKYLFNTTVRRKIEREGSGALNDVPILNASNEDDFKKLFFELMHFFKAKANLSDYADLNRRYFKTTNTMIFFDGEIRLDVLPHCWLHSIINELSEIAFSSSKDLFMNVELPEIAQFLVLDENKLYTNLYTLYGIKANNAIDVDSEIKKKQYERLNILIDKKFNRARIIDLFRKFETRDDDAIREAVTNNADIPTIFEYIIGIAWYLISDRQGDILSYMNLSLEADLLPRTHAGGGIADIEYKYLQTDTYPAHTLLIEATLTTDVNQRRAEIEPVSRHLGDYILSTGDKNAYCIFVSSLLHRNTISDYRNRKTYEHFSVDFKDIVKGLKIIPLATPELRKILECGINYKQLFDLFESAYRSDSAIPVWYCNEIVKGINNIL